LDTVSSSDTFESNTPAFTLRRNAVIIIARTPLPSYKLQQILYILAKAVKIKISLTKETSEFNHLYFRTCLFNPMLIEKNHWTKNSIHSLTFAN
jgi:hypothetical protein